MRRRALHSETRIILEREQDDDTCTDTTGSGIPTNKNLGIGEWKISQEDSIEADEEKNFLVSRFFVDRDDTKKHRQ